MIQPTIRGITRQREHDLLSTVSELTQLHKCGVHFHTASRRPTFAPRQIFCELFVLKKHLSFRTKSEATVIVAGLSIFHRKTTLAFRAITIEVNNPFVLKQGRFDR